MNRIIAIILDIKNIVVNKTVVNLMKKNKTADKKMICGYFRQ